MKYIVENDRGKVMLRTDYFNDISDEDGIYNMLKAGYKIKEDGKIITKKRLNELISQRRGVDSDSV